MRILYGITKSNFGGAQRYVYDLATSAKEKGFHVGVICGGNGLLVEKLRRKDIYAQSLPFLIRDISLWEDLKSLMEIYSTVKKNRPDVFHINSSKMGLGALAGRLAGVKRIIFTVHGLPYEEDRGSLSKALIKFFSWLTFVFSHQIIVLSKKNYDQVRSLPGVKNKIKLIYNAITKIEMQSREDARNYLLPLSNQTIPRDSLWVGTISELTKNKGLEFALQGLARLDNKNWNFIIIGDGEENESLNKLAQTLNIKEKIFFLGHINNASLYLKSFDIFTLTSVKEGMPYVLLEASQAGVPVVASRLPGIEEIVTDKISGILTEPKNILEFEKAIASLIKDPSQRIKLSENLKKEVAQKFSFSQMIEQTLQLYRN